MIPNHPTTHVDIRIYMPRGYIQYHDKLKLLGITYIDKVLTNIGITYLVIQLCCIYYIDKVLQLIGHTNIVYTINLLMGGRNVRI